jgi:hypothetical protein
VAAAVVAAAVVAAAVVGLAPVVAVPPHAETTNASSAVSIAIRLAIDTSILPGAASLRSRGGYLSTVHGGIG